jgi:hypothetical protein
MNRRFLFVLGTTAVWLVAMILVAFGAVQSISVEPWGNPRGESRSPILAGADQVGQQFTAPYPGLYAIELGLDTPAASSANRIIFHLKSDPLAVGDLWTATLETGSLREGAARIEFPPIRNSMGQTYFFSLELPEAVPDDGIAIRYSRDSALEGAQVFLGGQPIAGNLQFHSFYTLRTRDKVSLLLARMAESRPYLFGNQWFYIGLAVAYVFALALFMWHAAALVLDEGGA